MSVRIAVVQPLTSDSAREEMVGQAVDSIAQAAAAGAKIVCLPETYPGPRTPPVDYDALPALAGAARDAEAYVIAGLVEDVPGEPSKHYNTLVLLDPAGEEVGRYRRTLPSGPWIYKGGDFWDFDYLEGDQLPVFATPYGTIGLLVCSEVYVPELARLLAVKGAEIIFMPAGGWKRSQWANWRTLMHARAIENLAYTATCQNIRGHETGNAGLAMICSPEEIVAESSAPGILVADCDLDRVRMLREAEDGPAFSGYKACKAGALWQWYRPDVLAKLA